MTPDRAPCRLLSFRFVFALCLGMTGTVALGSFAHAETSSSSSQGEATGGAVFLNAMSYSPVSTNTASIRLYQDTDDEREIKRKLTDALEAAGWTIVKDGTGGETAPLRFSFDLVADDIGAAPSYSGVVEMDVNHGTRPSPEYNARANVFSSDQPSLVTGARKGTGMGHSAVRFTLTLMDTTNGRRLWDGWATGPLHAPGPIALVDESLNDLVAAIGKTVHGKGANSSRLPTSAPSPTKSGRQ